jgi:ArsR family transcriptional regulator
MGASKKENFSDKQNGIAAMCKALGHPARIAILEFLVKTNKCICGDIVNELPLSQPTVSQHLKELKSAGLISGSVEGTSICYCINEKALEKIQSYFLTVATKLDKKNNSCC